MMAGHLSSLFTSALLHGGALPMLVSREGWYKLNWYSGRAVGFQGGTIRCLGCHCHKLHSRCLCTMMHLLNALIQACLRTADA